MCRYATAGGIRESALAAGLSQEEMAQHGAALYARLRLFSPGGPMARELAKNPTALMVNDTLFAHGGVMPHHGEVKWKFVCAVGGSCTCHCQHYDCARALVQVTSDGCRPMLYS